MIPVLGFVWLCPQLVSGSSAAATARRVRVARMTLDLADDAVLHRNPRRIKWLADLLSLRIGLHVSGPGTVPNIFDLSEYLSVLADSFEPGPPPTAEDTSFIRGYRESVGQELERDRLGLHDR